MARWQKPPRRKRRARWWPRLLGFVLLICSGYAGYIWWLQRLPPSNEAATTPDRNRAVVPTQTTPEYYGSKSILVPIGEKLSARLVDKPDSTAPLVVILTASADQLGSWSGVQSTLEQFGVGSLVVSVATGEAAVHRAVEFMVSEAKRRSQPVGFLAVGNATDLALGLGAESSLADRPLVLLSPPLPRRAALDGLLARAPAWIRHALTSSSDSRLADWRGRVLVVRAKEERRFDAVAANALVAGSHRASTLVVPGNGFEHAPLHPDQESWRAIADFLRGVVRKREEIVIPQDSATFTP